MELEFSRLRATYFKSLLLLLAQHVFYSKFPDPICWWKWLFIYFRKELYRTEQLATFLGPFWWLCSWLGMFIVNPSWSNLGKCHGYVHYSMSAIGLCLLGCACLGRTQWSWIQNNLDFYWHAPHVPLSPDFLSSCNCRCKLNWTSWKILQLCAKTSTSILDLLCVQYGPCCKASVDASSGITKLRMSSTATPWITFSLCWNLPGHDSPWFAFVVWSKRFCQMVVWAWHVTRCPAWKSPWFPVDGRSCLYPMIDACSRALTNMEGLFVHSGQTHIFFPNIPR